MKSNNVVCYHKNFKNKTLIMIMIKNSTKYSFLRKKSFFNDLNHKIVSHFLSSDFYFLLKGSLYIFYI